MAKRGLGSLGARLKFWPFFLKPLESTRKVSAEYQDEVVLTKVEENEACPGVHSTVSKPSQGLGLGRWQVLEQTEWEAELLGSGRYL